MRYLSARTTLTDAIIDQLRQISPANDYRLPLGDNVFVAREIVEEMEVPCCLVMPGDEVPAENAGPNGASLITYTIAAYVARKDSSVVEYVDDPGAEFAQVDAIVADIRDAIEGDGCELDGKAETYTYTGATPIYRERGGELCGAVLTYTIETPYIDYIPG